VIRADQGETLSDSSSTFETFVSPFGWRYGSHEMRRVWSEVHKRRTWRQLWVALAEAQATDLQMAQEFVDAYAITLNTFPEELIRIARARRQTE
jgi:adenylosuccinate lyase